MERVMWGETAFRYYQVPPQVLALYPPLPQPLCDPDHAKLAQSPIVVDLLGTPIHRLVESKNNSAATKLYVSHTVSRELPFGSIRETEHGFQVASPALTLLGMASSMSKYQLLMAAFELCGTYSTFEPDPRSEQILAHAVSQGVIGPRDGWRRTVASNGRATNLWMREPLASPEELAGFVAQAQGFHGVKALTWAASHITGVCASPFEAKASMLLGLPKASGGMGMRFANNHRINLSSAAQALYQHECCYADLYVEATDTHGPVAIECQGASVHSGEAAGLSDARRTAALALMGVQVLPITYDQLAKADGWIAIKQLLAHATGIDLAKTPRQRKAETNLRYALFPNTDEGKAA